MKEEGISLKQFLCDRVANVIGLERAERILGHPFPAPTSKRYQIVDSFAKLATTDESAREDLGIIVPPPKIAPYSDSDIKYMVGAGIKNALLVSDLIEEHMPHATTALDFGSGTGRLSRIIRTIKPRLDIFNADVNPAAINWLETQMPGRTQLIATTPPTPFAEAQFDVVYAWSIFSHYAEELHKNWLLELRRITKSGGLILLTIHNERHIQRTLGFSHVSDADKTSILRDYNSNGFAFYRCYGDDDGGFGLDANTFGGAFISHNYVRRNWTVDMQILDITTAVEGWQDMVVLRAV